MIINSTQPSCFQETSLCKNIRKIDLHIHFANHTVSDNDLFCDHFQIYYDLDNAVEKFSRTGKTSIYQRWIQRHDYFSIDWYIICQCHYSQYRIRPEPITYEQANTFHTVFCSQFDIAPFPWYIPFKILTIHINIR